MNITIVKLRIKLHIKHTRCRLTVSKIIIIIALKLNLNLVKKHFRPDSFMHFYTFLKKKLNCKLNHILLPKTQIAIR